MDFLITLAILLASYLVGSIPFGLFIVRMKTGKDIRTVESGRTGGTNAMRAAGFWAGLVTGILDIFKTAGATWLALWLQPASPWVHVLAPVLAIVGHNYSIFLVERTPGGGIHWRGGAGGTPTVGGAMGLWWPSVLILFPAGMLILFGIGYASVATMSMGIMATILFAIRAAMGLCPWEYVAYGILAEILIFIALRPNIERLMKGTERIVGWRARRMKEKR